MTRPSGPPSRQDPPPECVTSTGTTPGLHPRRLPELRLACAVTEGAAQRYRLPLWRAYEGLEPRPPGADRS
jgi:hypothetical protein